MVFIQVFSVSRNGILNTHKKRKIDEKMELKEGRLSNSRIFDLSVVLQFLEKSFTVIKIVVHCCS